MFPRQEVIERWCAFTMEGGWLLSFALTPLAFNPYSARVFEPDKIALLRSIVLCMLAVVTIRLLNRAGSSPSAPHETNAGVDTGLTMWKRLLRTPFGPLITCYGVVFVLATVLSVEPKISLWGSYARDDGLHTQLTYIALFVLVSWTLRSWQQIDRLITVVLLSGLVVAVYGIVQRLGLDPLPWSAEVPERVTSTLGNPIFVGAYLVVVVPFGLMRLAAVVTRLRVAAPTASPMQDIARAVAPALLVIGTCTLFVACIKTLAVVRDNPAHAWLQPSTVAVSVMLWLTPLAATGIQAGRVRRLSLLVFVVFVTLFVAVLLSGLGRSAPGANDRWLWLTGSVVAIAGGFALSKVTADQEHRRSALSSRLEAAGLAVMLAIMLAALLFTQSRGPWLGLAAGMVAFVLLICWKLNSDSRLTASSRTRTLVRWAAITIVVLSGVMIALMLALNTSEAPIVQGLRELPYLGRLGRIFDVTQGTGLERLLFWTGDDAGGGAIGLVMSDPLRSVVGWGPETMLLVYEPFYPPSLGPLLRYLATDRYLAPDRAHQAMLDMLVTRGLLGLGTYLAILITFGVRAVRLIRREPEGRTTLLMMACLSSVIGSVIEQSVGIPIAATALPFWASLAIIANAPFGSTAPTQTVAAPAVPGSVGPHRRRRARRVPLRDTRATPLALVVYATLGMTTLVAVWLLDLRPIVADMQFQEGRTLLAQGTDARVAAPGLFAVLSASKAEAEQDLYYLTLGQSVQRIAEQRRAAAAASASQDAGSRLDALLAAESPEAVWRIIDASSLPQLLATANAALDRGRALSPRNKEHVLALARLNRTWYDWTLDPSRLEQAAAWYRTLTMLAPHDVPLLLERARLVAVQADRARADGRDPSVALSEAAALVGEADRLLPGDAEVQRARAEIERRRQNQRG